MRVDRASLIIILLLSFFSAFSEAEHVLRVFRNSESFDVTLSEAGKGTNMQISRLLKLVVIINLRKNLCVALLSIVFNLCCWQGAAINDDHLENFVSLNGRPLLTVSFLIRYYVFN